MRAGTEQMGVKTGLSASPLHLPSLVFFLISHGGAQTVKEQKAGVFLNVNSLFWPVGSHSGVLDRRRGVKYGPKGDQ